MKCSQRLHGVHDLSWKQPYQCRNNARELCVTLREVMRPVQIVQKEVCCLSEARGCQQIGVGRLEPSMLVLLDQPDPLCMGRVCLPAPALTCHLSQVAQYALTRCAHRFARHGASAVCSCRRVCIEVR